MATKAQECRHTEDVKENLITGNGVVGILAETCNMWERRAPLCPAHCARLLLDRRGGVRKIVVQPSPKRIHHDDEYADVGCEISEDLSPCGLILGIKPPKTERILPGRSYAFFSHTHKAQAENMPLLDKVLTERVTLYDYELMVGEDGKRVLAFGKFAGRAGLIDFLHGLGQRYLSLGYSTPFLSLGSSHMYTSLTSAKSAIISVGEEISTMGLPLDICPIVFVFTGTGNVSLGAQEIFKLLPHTFVEPHKLPELADTVRNQVGQSKRVFQVYGCIVTCQHMVSPKDPDKKFNKDEYYAHPERYNATFHEKIAPYTSVIVNCMYWEKRFPRLLSNKQLHELMSKKCPLVGISDITCDIGGSMEFVNRTTTIEKPFFRYDPGTNSYHEDMVGEGIICLAVDILPTEFPREASKYFGDILSGFVGKLARTRNLSDLHPTLKRACISFDGKLTQLYEYILRMRTPAVSLKNPTNMATGKKYTTMVSLSGHLFDQFLINEALDTIEIAGGSFHLIKCELGQNADDVSYSELEVGADDECTLERIVDSLASISSRKCGKFYSNKDKFLFKEGNTSIGAMENGKKMSKDPKVLILGAGRVCQPAAELLASYSRIVSSDVLRAYHLDDGELENVQVIVASLFLQEAEEITDSIPNSRAVQLDVMDEESLSLLISDVNVVISLLPSSFHLSVAKQCIEHKKHLVTASYVDDSISKLDEKAKSVGITILAEMGLDPGIDHMVAMKMIDQAHARNGKVTKFTSYCGGLPSPEAANNPLAYKFSWNPAGALKAGRQAAMYKNHGETIQVKGDELYDSAVRFQIPDIPTFALEFLPNRNSLAYGNLYGINDEALTIFRATLRYEGFSEIMGTLAKLGFFDTEAHPILKDILRPTFCNFLGEILKTNNDDHSVTINDDEMARRIISLRHSEEPSKAMKTIKTIKFLELDEDEEIPAACHSAFDVACLRMEEKLTYSDKEKDMVILHHELEVDFPDKQKTEIHQATLLEFGRLKDGKMTSAMALTVGIPAAVGALLLLCNRIKTTGVLRPLTPEVYIPALEILEACGIKMTEKVNILS